MACGSDPENGTENKMGAYLMKTFFQGTCISSAMFITAMAANPLSVNLAAAAIGETISWTQWAVAAFVPGLFCLITVPLILYIIYPPEVKDSPEAPKKAKEELAKLGPMGRDEKIMAVSLLSTVAMWVFGASYGINAVAAALSGLTILLVTGVISWKECLNENGAWNTFTWFAALISMAGCLNKFGLIPWFSQQVVSVVGGWGLAWQPAFVIIVLLYYYSHYLFASGAAHIGAMYTAFLSVAVACGSPPLMSALCLGMLSNIMGRFTTTESEARRQSSELATSSSTSGTPSEESCPCTTSSCGSESEGLGGRSWDCGKRASKAQQFVRDQAKEWLD